MSKYKKVCILTTVHMAQDGRIFHKEAKSLARAGYSITLIGQNGQDETVDGVKILDLRKPKSRAERFFVTAMTVLIKALKERADIYHFHDPELVLVGLLLKILGNKVIYDVHEDYSKAILARHYLPKFLRKIIAKLSNPMEKAAAALFDAIATVSNDILKRFYRNRKAVILYNYPIMPQLTKGERKVTAGGNSNLIYAGGLTEERGTGEIVKAMAYLKEYNVKLTLCGEFTPKEYELEVKGLKGFEKVDYLGLIEQELVWLKITQATAGIVIYRPVQRFIDTRPTKLFDYMAAGLPVIASDFPLWKEVVEGNNCGLVVNPLDPMEIARAIKYLIEHPDEARGMGQNGRKAATGKYDWQNEEKKLLKIYADLFKE